MLPNRSAELECNRLLFAVLSPFDGLMSISVRCTSTVRSCRNGIFSIQ